MNRFLSFSILLWAVFSISSCKKSTWPYPVLTMQYQSSQGNFDQSCEENGNGSNTCPTPGEILTQTHISGDSVIFMYSSWLTSAGNRLQVTLYATFPKSRLDSVNGTWMIRENEDFNNLFTPRNATIPSPSNNYHNGIDIRIQPANHSSDYALVHNYADTSNQIEITERNTELDWTTYFDDRPLGPGVYRLIWTSLNFRGRLVDTNGDTLTVTNGKYQGIFVDRL